MIVESLPDADRYLKPTARHTVYPPPILSIEILRICTMLACRAAIHRPNLSVVSESVVPLAVVAGASLRGLNGKSDSQLLTDSDA